MSWFCLKSWGKCQCSKTAFEIIEIKNISDKHPGCVFLLYQLLSLHCFICQNNLHRLTTEVNVPWFLNVFSVLNLWASVSIAFTHLHLLFCASGAPGLEIRRLCRWEGQDSPSAQDLQSPHREGAVSWWWRVRGSDDREAKYIQILNIVFVLHFDSLIQEKEIYRWPIRESLKSMLAMGWSIDRTKDGESMSQQRENEKMRKISQTSQVQCKKQ